MCPWVWLMGTLALKDKTIPSWTLSKSKVIVNFQPSWVIIPAIFSPIPWSLQSAGRKQYQIMGPEGFMYFKRLLLPPCRILCSVLLSLVVIVVRPVLIIQVGTHLQQVKGIKSYLTLSGGSRSHGRTVHLWMSLCWCHSVNVTPLMSTMNVTL